MVKDSLDAINVVFDDDRSVADAGVLAAATLARRLGIEALVNECVDLGRRVGYFRPGRKVMSLVHAMLLGADSIDDCDVLRSGRTARVLGHRVMAPSTLGTFLRAFTFGHVRHGSSTGSSTGKANTQRGIIRFCDELIARVRRAGATGEMERIAETSNRRQHKCCRSTSRVLSSRYAQRESSCAGAPHRGALAARAS
jgi:hypothetical protein